MNQRATILLLMLSLALVAVLIPLRPLRPAARSGTVVSANPAVSREAGVDPTARLADHPDEPDASATENPAVGEAALAQHTASPGGEDPAEALTTLPPFTVMENMRTVFRLYSSRFGGNPVGTNPEITASLMGGNPGRVMFIKTADGLQLSGAGELLDSWGTPYFFHQLSRIEMEIRSAGPDRHMWTGDDLVMR